MNSRSTTALVFAATMTLAGFLLFQVQLVLGKFILPWFGGSASTWLVCMLFFQVALLVGYAHAYAITLPLTIHRQAQLQIGILVLTLLLLPIAPSDSWKPADASDPTWRILGLLAVCVGLPYIALATTTPLLSRWLAHIAPDLNPVRFFAASNIGLVPGSALLSVLLRTLAAERGADALVVLGLRALCGSVCCLRRAHDQPRAKLQGFRCERAADGQRRSSADVGAVFRTRFGSPDRNHQCHHAMVGGRALPVGRPAQRVSPHLRDRLRLSAGLPPCAVWRSVPAAGRNKPCPARAGSLPLSFHRAGAADGDAFRGLHDLPCGNGETAAGACAPAEVLSRHCGGRRARRHRRRAGRASSLQGLFRAPPGAVGNRRDRAVAHVAARRRIEDGPDRGRVCRRPHFPGWSLKEPRGGDRRQPVGRANPQFLRRRQDRAAVPG